jgi:hypothetical protein
LRASIRPWAPNSTTPTDEVTYVRILVAIKRQLNIGHPAVPSSHLRLALGLENLPALTNSNGKVFENRLSVVPSDAGVCNAHTVLKAFLALLRNLLAACGSPVVSTNLKNQRVENSKIQKFKKSKSPNTVRMTHPR